VRQDGLTVTRRCLGLSRTKVVAAADVTGVEMPIRMQVGDTPFYTVEVQWTVPGRRFPGRVTVADDVRDKREAERLVATIEATLGRARGVARS
jgi:hypothetical protein